jgi:hypothetical protein
VTADQKTKLAALIQEVRANQREKDRQIAKMLRIVLQVLANPRHKDRAALPAALRDLITTLEKE